MLTYNASLNGDGRDDYMYVSPKGGNVVAWINQGKIDGTWSWKKIGDISRDVGADAYNLYFVDIDGKCIFRLVISLCFLYSVT